MFYSCRFFVSCTSISIGDQNKNLYSDFVFFLFLFSDSKIWLIWVIGIIWPVWKKLQVP